MPRIFLSHSRLDNRQAIALRQWLVEQNPPLADEIFLDLHPDTGIRPGVRWKDALREASARCEAVICLLSPNWEASPECKTEYRFAEYLNKRIFSVLIAPLTGDDPTREWQQIDLRGDGTTTAVDIHDGAEPVEFSSEGLHRLRQGIVGSGIAAESFVWPPPDNPERAPYRGWEPLEEVDAAIFFGRDAEIVQGLDALRGMRRSGLETSFVLLGPSGTGKSSFLRAGLLPRLRRDDREFTVLDIVRPQRNVLTGDTGFARSIHTTRMRLGLTEPSLGEIKKACNSADANAPRAWLLEIQRAASARLLIEADKPPLPTLVLPVDQGEELFGVDAGDEAPQFLELIAALATGNRDDSHQEKPGLVVAFTIRTDRYVSLQTAPQLAAAKTVVFDELKPMPRTQFKEVIKGPAERATQGSCPLDIDESLVNRLLDDCTEGADTLPLLALTLSRLYEDYASSTPAPRPSTLTLAHYGSMGGMRSVVQTEINNLLSADPTQRAAELRLLRTAFIPWLATINPDNDQPMRRLARWTDLPKQSHPLLERFVATRLLVRDDRDGEVTVEVALESLLRQWDELAAWLTEEREDLKTADALEHAALAWRNNRRDGAWLLQGTRLAEAEALADDPDFSDRLASIRDYLNASREQENARIEAEKQQREAKLCAAQQLAATESAAREQAQAHAAVLKKRSRVLRVVLAVTLVVATAAVVGFVKATQAQHREEAARSEADSRARAAVAQKLTAEGQAMLAGINTSGDARALQEILAAPGISTTVDEGAMLYGVTSLRDTLKIIGQPGEVLSAAFSPDGRRIVSASRDGTVRIWNAETGQPMGEPMTGHNSEVYSVAFSPDGHRIVSGSRDMTVRLWDAETRQPIGTPLVGHANIVYSVAFSPDGHRIVSGSEDHTARIWNADTGEAIGALTGHAEAVWSVAFSPDGHRIVSASADKTMQLWNADTRLPTGAPLRRHTDAVRSAAFSPDGHRIVSASADRTVRVWNADTRQEIGAALEGHTDIVRSAAFSPNGRRIVSAGRDKTVRIWDADTGKLVGAELTGHTQSISSVVFSPDGTRIATASDDRTLRIWRADADQPLGTILEGATDEGPTDVVRSVTFSPDGRSVASAGDGGKLRLWNADTGQPIDVSFEGQGYAVNSVAFSPDGHRMVSAGDDTTLRLWNADTGQQIGAPLQGHSDEVYTVAFSPDGHRIVSGGRDHELRLWNAETGKQIGEALKGHDSVVNSVVFSPDGHRIVSGGDDHTARLWDADTGDPIGMPIHHTDVVRSVVFSPDGNRIVSAGFDKTIRVWDADTLQSIGSLPSTERVYSVRFSSDGRRILAGNGDRTLQLWNVETGQPMGPPLDGHTQQVVSIDISPDGRRIASGGYDATVRIWPGPAVWPELLCDKLIANMSKRQWDEWVSSDIDYLEVCPGLPITPDN